MRSYVLPFKLSITLILFILLFSSHNIFAQSGWQSIYSGSNNYNFQDVHFKDTQNGLTVTLSGIIFKTTNGGINWDNVYENSTYPMINIKFLNDTNLLVFRTNGHLLRTTNYGYNWSEILTPLSETSKQINFLNELTGYILGGRQYIQKTTNGGLNWDSIGVSLVGMPFPGANSFSDMSFIDVNTGWLCATGNIVIGGHGTFWSNIIKKTTDGGYNWSTVFTGNSSTLYNKIKFFNENTGWTWADGIIYQTTNGGANWSIYTQLPNFTINKFHFLNSITGWATITSGPNFGLLKTSNLGLNWYLQFVSSNIYVNSVYIQNQNIAWFSGSNSAIYKTTDGGGMISAINPVSGNIPDAFFLQQNYPNPFNLTTKINFDLKNTAFAMLRVYDITGREVSTLVNERLNAGSYSYDFNASELPSGVYFYQLQTEGFIETKKMILLK